MTRLEISSDKVVVNSVRNQLEAYIDVSKPMLLKSEIDLNEARIEKNLTLVQVGHLFLNQAFQLEHAKTQLGH